MITLTEIASKKILESLSKRNQGLGIRIGVKSSGCNGFQYILEYVDQPLEHDTIYTSNNVKIYVDFKSLPYIGDLTIDWQKQRLSEGFKFTNSLEESRCGCGESFAIKS